jgi:hypothetical protein
MTPCGETPPLKTVLGGIIINTMTIMIFMRIFPDRGKYSCTSQNVHLYDPVTDGSARLGFPFPLTE